MIRSISLVVAALLRALWGGAARAQMSQADLLTRIDRLEAALRELTGTVEQLQYRNQQLEQQLRALQDASQAGARPPASPQPQPPPRPTGTIFAAACRATAAGHRRSAAACAYRAGAAAVRRPDAAVAAMRSIRRLNPAAPGAPRPLGTSTAATEPPPPVADAPPAGRSAPARRAARSVQARRAARRRGAIRPLPPPPPSNPSGTGAMQATLPPGNSPKDEYDLAYGYLQHKDYASRRGRVPRLSCANIRAIAWRPRRNTGSAKRLFQSQHYRDAAEAFLAVSTKYDTTARAPDALLRLGMSLAALGEKEAACASLGEVLRKYPRASVSVKQGVDREQKRAHC